MGVKFKSGDLVANKANPIEAFTFLQMQNDDVNAVLLNGSGQKIIFPVVALIKYESPKGPIIRDMSNRW